MTILIVCATRSCRQRPPRASPTPWTPSARPSPSRPRRSSACSRGHGNSASPSRSTPNSSRTSRARRSPRASARCPPITSSMWTRPALRAMAAAGTVAVLLPAAFYYLLRDAAAAGRTAAPAQGTDRDRERPQSRQRADRIIASQHQYGLHALQADARRSIRQRHATRGNGARARRHPWHDRDRQEPLTSRCGTPAIPPNSRRNTAWCGRPGSCAEARTFMITLEQLNRARQWDFFPATSASSSRVSDPARCAPSYPSRRS